MFADWIQNVCSVCSQGYRPIPNLLLSRTGEREESSFPWHPSTIDQFFKFGQSSGHKKHT